MTSTEMIKGMGEVIDYIKKIEKENMELKEENMIIKKICEKCNMDIKMYHIHAVNRDDENKKLKEENEKLI